MKTLNINEVSRDFSSVMAAMEAGQEEVLLVRNRKPVSRLVPEPAPQDALEAFGDICGALDDETADALSAAVDVAKKSGKGSVSELRNPWAS
jgi:antitoxin (DNA-binding transcriptional repressor) of toxin-antitoxin stability system